MAWMAKAATIVARRQAQLSVAVSAAAEAEKLLQHGGESEGAALQLAAVRVV